MKTKHLLFTFLMITGFVIAGYGQTMRSVAWVNSNFDEGEGVCCQGQVTGEVAGSSDDEYYFSDGSNQIIVEFDQDIGVPSFNTDITIGGIMDYDNSQKEIDIKYWHAGSQSIVQKLGIISVSSLNGNPQNDQAFVCEGEFTGPVSGQDDEYYFEDNTDDLVAEFDQNADAPTYDQNAYLFGVVNAWGGFVNYNIYYWELTGSSSIPELNPEEVKIYPNPATDYLKFETNKDLKVHIANVMGQVVVNSQVSGYQSLDISHLTPGQYILYVYEGEQVLGSTRIIVR